MFTPSSYISPPGKAAARSRRVPWLLFPAVVLVFGHHGSIHAQEPIRYTVAFVPALEDVIGDLLRPFSDTLAQRDDPPLTIPHLRRRAQRDILRFEQALRAEGYYASETVFEIDETVSPVTVTFRIVPGPRYRLEELSVAAIPETPAPGLPSPADLGLRTGAPARTEVILNAERRLRTWLLNRGYPFVTIGARDAIVDHDTQTMDLRLVAEPGLYAKLGEVRIEGLESVEEEAVLRRLPWKQGDIFSQVTLNAARTALIDSELFSRASFTPVNEPDEYGEIPVLIEVTERKHRTFAAGLNFSTDLGLGVDFLWEHRNLQGLGRRFTAETLISRELNQLELHYRRPFAGADNRSLLISAEFAQEDSDAFDSTRIILKGLHEHTLDEINTVLYGAGLRVSRVEQRRRTESYQLLFFPVEWRRDTSNDRLDPTEGSRLTLGLTPFLSVSDAGSPFLLAEVNYAQYIGLDEDGAWILAVRGRLGSILGASTNQIPPDVRLYAGGGGSVRGFPFRSASPLDRDKPIGGKSAAEASVELRRRINETFGAVVFVDAGSAFESSWPDVDPTPRIGVGTGLRVFTPFGPIRLDLAIPANRRKGVDDAFQVYLSIGQAF